MIDFDKRDANGCRRVKCERPGCGWVSNSRTPYPPEQIHFPCKAWPQWREIGSWLALFLAAIGISKYRYAWASEWLGLIEKCASDCSSCDAREKWLNTLGGRAYTLAQSGNRFAKLFVWWCVRTQPQSLNKSIASDAP